ncbi:MAG: DNA replication/repair protein RecF [Clostridia bacterium]|nr:DNA replication/repair protein RecF [Clostridia bacterium]
MKINELEIKNFRNLTQIDLKPDPGMNVIYGENAQGKTNLIEAIWMLSGMKSFRGAKDTELKAFDSDFARISASFENADRTNDVEMTVTDRRRAVLNGVALLSPSALLGKFGAVVFSPAFLSIVQNGPSERRKFIDAAVCRISPAYATVLAEYARLLRQRNSLLKDVYHESSLLDMLDILDEKLARTGEVLIRRRKAFLEQLTPFVRDIYNGLSSGRETLQMRYVTQYDEEKQPLQAYLRENRKNDLINKTTCVGPHRDDMEILIDGARARLYGSQGQQRSCALALKLGESSVIKSVTGEEPVTLLDDVMSELDTNRQDYVLNHIKNRQVFITCCEPSSVIRLNGGKRINIAGGRIVSCT